MRVGIDLQVLPQDTSQMTGVSHYAYQLAKSLLKLGSKHEFVLFVSGHSVPRTSHPRPVRHSRGGGNLRGKLDTESRSSMDFRSPIRVEDKFRGNDSAVENASIIDELNSLGGEVVVLPAKSIPFISTHWSRAKVMEKSKLDILHGPAFTTPVFYKGKTVVSIHDLAIYLHPEWFPGGQWVSTKILVPRSIKRASKVIVPSLSTAKDLKALFKVSEDKISVIPMGVSAAFFTGQKLDQKIPYILTVATLEPRKNIERVLEAYSMLPKEIVDKYELWIVGNRGWKYKKIFDSQNRLNPIIKAKVKFLGAKSSEKLIELYANATLFVFPSLYEGFGLPVLEAMAAGIPVVTSNASSIPEFASGVAKLVNPTSSEEIANAIQESIRDGAYLRQSGLRGVARAREYTWEKTARLTMELYEQS